jgi:hypothetical protein
MKNMKKHIKPFCKVQGSENSSIIARMYGGLGSESGLAFH